MGPIQVTRRPERFLSDDSRVIAHHFHVGGEQRARSIIARVLSLAEAEVAAVYAKVLRDFSHRHRRIEAAFERHFAYMRHYIDTPDTLSRHRQLLIGAYFTMEYSIESAALFNPSIVRHPDQNDLPEGAMRFLLSLSLIHI